jgi:potassium/hydrogen antiporter
VGGPARRRADRARPGLEGSEAIFDLVFVLVVVFTLVQAPTLPFVARKLRVSDPEHLRELDVDVSPVGSISADVLQVRIGPESQMHGIEIFELRLPPGVNVTLVLRDGESIVPSRRTVLQQGDDLVVVAPTHLRRETEARLRAVHAEGKLARWRTAPMPAGPARPGLERTRVRARWLARRLPREEDR